MKLQHLLLTLCLCFSVLTAVPAIAGENHKVTYEVIGGNGTLTAVDWNTEKITINSGDDFPHNEMILFTASPNVGYRVKRWKNNGVPEGLYVKPQKTFLFTVTEPIHITIVFELIKPNLDRIEVSKLPDKTTYTKGETLDLTGIELTVYYEGGESETTTDYYFSLPDHGSELKITGKRYITVYYKNGQGYKESEFYVTVNSPTGINDTPQAQQLKAWVQNERLTIKGLSKNKAWSLHNISGVLIHQDITNNDEVNIPLPTRGIYIVTSGRDKVKVVY